MAKIVFELQGRITYYSQNGAPIHRDIPYWQYTCQGIDPFTAGIVYHDNEVFYRRRFEGKRVWDTIDEIELYRRRPEFRDEIQAAAVEKGIDLDKHDVYFFDVMPERIK